MDGRQLLPPWPILLAVTESTILQNISRTKDHFILVKKDGKLEVMSLESLESIQKPIQWPTECEISAKPLSTVDLSPFAMAISDRQTIVNILKNYIPMVFLTTELVSTAPLLIENESMRVFVNNIADHTHSGIRGLLFWLCSNNLIFEEMADMELCRELPFYLHSPVRIGFEYKSIMERPIGKDCILRLKSPNAKPTEIYAVLQPDKTAILIEPAFTRLFLKFEAKPIVNSSQTKLYTPRTIRRKSLMGSFKNRLAPLDNPSVSLSQWTPSQGDASQLLNEGPTAMSSSLPDPTTMACTKTANKLAMKKLMLLSLRNVGVDKHHVEFGSIWKHLYCACLFAFRKELGCRKIEQADMLSVIRSNMNFLNIK